AIGVNYIDVYDRTGQYPRALPAVVGREAAGVITALGSGVRDFRIGQRVAYVTGTAGAYSVARNIAANSLVRLPRAISDEQAAVLMLKGLTVEYLLRRTYRVARGDYLLVHAAAGGVGSLLTQWGRTLGAKLIGVVGNDEKAVLARKQGCHQVLISGRDKLVEGVRAYTRGHMADVVYDSVGKDTFLESLDCLRPRGLMVSYGNASGPPAAIAPLELARRGSLTLTRPTLFDYIRERAELDTAARAVFSQVSSGKLKVRICQRYPLREAAQAHRDLEARRTVGATVLVP
ncbi:MAG TPA: quinone oxidoreductase, partial [Steroidobacteraceae bacterium]|nr:quinone oxidoreductase [Steroidobacteraceae bacterium]